MSRSQIPIAQLSRFFALCGLLLFTSLVFAEDPEAEFDRANDAYQQGDFEEARRIWMPLAKASHPKAQLGMGNLYFKGASDSPPARRSGPGARFPVSARVLRRVAHAPGFGSDSLRCRESLGTL